MIPFLSLPGVRRFERFFNLDVALRYLPVVDRLSGARTGRLLEVGSSDVRVARTLNLSVRGWIMRRWMSPSLWISCSTGWRPC